MSKLFSNKKYYLKPIKQNNESYINQSMQNILDSYSKSQQGISKDFSSFNKNNITIDYPKHYSPTYRTPVYLPSINSNYKKINQSQNKKINNSINEGSLFSNIGNKIINGKKIFKIRKY